MGNSESVTIDIKINWEDSSREFARAGKKLNGEVILHVKQSVDGSPVKLIISGKEKAGLKVRRREQMVLNQADRRFFSVVLPLRSFPSQRRIAPGTYTFPFSVKLPRSLPSSESHPNEKSKIGFKIEYRMTAKFGKLYKELYFPLCSAPLSHEKIPCLIRPTQHTIHTLGVKEDGQVVLGAMVNNSIVGRGKDIELFLACRNDSVANIKCVEIQIVEFLRWTLGTKPETQDTSKVLKTIKSVALPSTCRSKRPSEVGRISTGKMYREIHEELRSRREPVLIRVPSEARDTYRGRLVSVWHCLKITFMTRSMSNNATAIVPITIGRPPSKNKQPLRAPTGSQQQQQQQQRAPAGTQQESHPMSAMVPVAPGNLSSVPENADVHGVKESAEDGTYTVMIAPEDLIILGAGAVNRRESRTDEGSVVSAPPKPVQVKVSLKSLLESMENAVSDFDLILGYLMDYQWVKLFGRLSPTDFGTVVSRVKVEVDQPRVAVMLAPHLNGGDNFTCQYAASAVKRCSVSYRSVMTKRVLPMCVDFKDNYKLILNELNEWERIATSNEFEEALLASSAN